MSLAIYIFTLLLNVFMSCIGKRSKIVVIVSSFAMFLIMGGNNYNSDYALYQRFYSMNAYPSSMEFGYVWIAKQISSLGLNYQTFVQLLIAVSIILMLLVASKYTEDLHTFIFLYMSTMMFLDVTQVRQFVAYIFVTIALIMHSKGYKLRFLLSLLIGTLFHITTIVYIPIVFLNASRVSSRKFIRVFFGTILFLCVFVFIGGNRIPWLTMLMSKYLDSQKMVYFSTSARFGFIKYFSFQIACIYFASIMRKYISNGNNEAMKSFSNTVYVAILYSSVAMPLVMLNSNFYRFFKFGLIGLFICACYVLDALRNRTKCGEPARIMISRRVHGDLRLFSLFILFFTIVFTVLMQSHENAFEVISNNMFF